MATLFTDEQLRKNQPLFVEFCTTFDLGVGDPVFEFFRGLMITDDPAKHITDWMQWSIDTAKNSGPNRLQR